LEIPRTDIICGTTLIGRRSDPLCTMLTHRGHVTYAIRPGILGKIDSVRPALSGPYLLQPAARIAPSLTLWTHLQVFFRFNGLIISLGAV